MNKGHLPWVFLLLLMVMLLSTGCADVSKQNTAGNSSVWLNKTLSPSESIKWQYTIDSAFSLNLVEVIGSTLMLGGTNEGTAVLTSISIDNQGDILREKTNLQNFRYQRRGSLLIALDRESHVVIDSELNFSPLSEYPYAVVYNHRNKQAIVKNEPSGEQRWEVLLQDLLKPIDTVAEGACFHSTNQVIIDKAGNSLYVFGIGRNGMAALDFSTGATLWQYQDSQYLINDTFIEDSYIYIAESSLTADTGRLTVLDSQGNVQQTLELPAQVFSVMPDPYQKEHFWLLAGDSDSQALYFFSPGSELELIVEQAIYNGPKQSLIAAKDKLLLGGIGAIYAVDMRTKQCTQIRVDNDFYNYASPNNSNYRTPVVGYCGDSVITIGFSIANGSPMRTVYCLSIP